MIGLWRSINVVKRRYKIVQPTGLLILLQCSFDCLHAGQGFPEHRFVECKSLMTLKLPGHIRFLIAVELFFEPVSLRLLPLQLRLVRLHLF